MLGCVSVPAITDIVSGSEDISWPLRKKQRFKELVFSIDLIK